MLLYPTPSNFILTSQLLKSTITYVFIVYEVFNCRFCTCDNWFLTRRRKQLEII